MSSAFLARMAEASRGRSHHAKKRLSAAELERRVDQMPPPPRPAFSPQGFDLIAEIKPRSPSEGRLAAKDFSPGARAKQYARGGAMALSALTEPSRFGGSLEMLAEVAAAVPGRPVMRKDFLVEPYQVLEARLHGAGGVLLIVGMTDDQNTEAMLQTAVRCGMFALLEAFNSAELERALHIAGRLQAPRDFALIGLNCRDLRTLAVDPTRFSLFQPRNRNGLRMFAESGIKEASQAAELAANGWDGWLMGTALMRAPDPVALAKTMLKEARRSRART